MIPTSILYIIIIILMIPYIGLGVFFFILKRRSACSVCDDNLEGHVSDEDNAFLDFFNSRNYGKEA